MKQIHLKCNAPEFEQHRGYKDDNFGIAIDVSDFDSLQRQFEARDYTIKTCFRNKPLRGTIKVEIDGFYYYAELYQEA